MADSLKKPAQATTAGDSSVGENKHTYVDQVRVRYGFSVIVCAFVLVGFTVGISVYFFFTANEAVAVIGNVTGMVVAIVSTWFGISSANSVANRALSDSTVPPVPQDVAELPTVTSIAPPSGPSGTEVTIMGTGFTGASAVSFGGVPSVDVKVISDTTITADVPEGKNAAAGTGVDVVVTSASGALSSTGQGTKFLFSGIGVGRLSPTHGKAKDVIAVLGSGFNADGSYIVQFSPKVSSSNVTFVDEMQLHVVVPDLPTDTQTPVSVIVAVMDSTSKAPTPDAFSQGHAQAVFLYDRA